MLNRCDVYLKRDEYDAIQAAIHDAIRSTYELASGAEDEQVAEMMKRYRESLVRARVAMNTAWWHEEVEA